MLENIHELQQSSEIILK